MDGYIYANNDPTKNTDPSGDDVCNGGDSDFDATACVDSGGTPLFTATLFINTLQDNSGSIINGIVDISPLSGTTYIDDCLNCWIFQDPVFANANGFVTALGWTEIAGIAAPFGAEVINPVTTQLVSKLPVFVQLNGPAIVGAIARVACGMACNGVPIPELAFESGPSIAGGYLSQGVKFAAGKGGRSLSNAEKAAQFLAMQHPTSGGELGAVNGAHWIRRAISLANGKDNPTLAAAADKMLGIWNKGTMNAASAVLETGSRELEDYFTKLGDPFASFDTWSQFDKLGRNEGCVAGKWPIPRTDVGYYHQWGDLDEK